MVLRRLAGLTTILAAGLVWTNAVVGEGPKPDLPGAASAKGEQSDPKTPRTISPLHAFLGIDPETGAFIPESAARGKVGSQKTTTSTGAPADGVQGASAGNSGSKADDLRAAVAEAIKNGDERSLAAILAAMPRTSSYEQVLELNQRYALISYLVLLIYPAWVVISESASWWSRHRRGDLTELDRRYYARRLRRRLTLAAALAASVALWWWAAANDFWWAEPRKFAVFAGGMLALIAVCAVLRGILRRAAVQHPVAALRELELKQLKLQQEVDELRKLVHSYRFAGGL